MAETARESFEFDTNGFDVKVEAKTDESFRKVERLGNMLVKIGIVGYAALVAYSCGHSRGYGRGIAEGANFGKAVGYAELADRLLSLTGK